MLSDNPAAIRAREERAKDPTRARASVNAYHAGIAAIIRQAKEGKACANCGVEDLPPQVLHLHHVRGKKRFTVSAWRKTAFPRKPGESKADAVRAEIAKCAVLCPTCHVREHMK